MPVVLASSPIARQPKVMESQSALPLEPLSDTQSHTPHKVHHEMLVEGTGEDQQYMSPRTEEELAEILLQSAMMDEAALTLQSVQRGRAERKKITAALAEREEEERRARDRRRRFICEQHTHASTPAEALLVELACIRMQKIFRGRAARAELAVERKASLLVQTMYRSAVARRVAEERRATFDSTPASPRYNRRSMFLKKVKETEAKDWRAEALMWQQKFEALQAATHQAPAGEAPDFGPALAEQQQVMHENKAEQIQERLACCRSLSRRMHARALYARKQREEMELQWSRGGP